MWYANLRKHTRLGTLLVKRRLITTTQLHEAVRLQRNRRDASLGDILVEQGWVTHDDIRRSLRRQARVRHVAALLAMLFTPLQVVNAGGFPSTSANAEIVAFADAERYADAPQLKMHDPHSRSNSVSTSLTKATQRAARLLAYRWWRSYRDDNNELSLRPASSKQIMKQDYSLRLSEDKALLRAKFRF